MASTLPQFSTVTPIVAKAALEAMKPMSWSIVNPCLLLRKFPGDTFLVFCRRGCPALIYPDLPCQLVKLFCFISNFLCASTHKKEKPFNLLWILKDKLSTESESVGSTWTCQNFCPCANTIYWTAIRALPVCSSVLVSCFQWYH